MLMSAPGKPNERHVITFGPSTKEARRKRLEQREETLREFRQAIAQAIKCAAALEFDPTLKILDPEYEVLCRIQLKVNLAIINETQQLREMRVQA